MWTQIEYLNMDSYSVAYLNMDSYSVAYLIMDSYSVDYLNMDSYSVAYLNMDSEQCQRHCVLTLSVNNLAIGKNANAWEVVSYSDLQFNFMVRSSAVACAGNTSHKM